MSPDPVPCARCGGFLQGEALSGGFSVCEECVERLVVGEPRGRSVANNLAVVGGLAGFLFVVVVGAFLSPIAFAYVHIFVGAGIFAGVIVGLPIDVVRTRRDRARKGFDGVAWIAVLDQKNPSRTVSGFAFPGAGRILFATKAGERLVLRQWNVLGTHVHDAKRVELELAPDAGAGKLVLVGADALGAAQRLGEMGA